MLVFGLDYDGVAIPCVKFECEKDTLPFPDASFGLVMFLDCLEHLVVDPMWPLLEFNRVLRKDGHLVTATPNAIGAFRIANILAGSNPATEHQIKPASIYQRYNREWTPDEVELAMQAAGFRAEAYSTNADALSADERSLLSGLQRLKGLHRPLEDHGPELLMIARKVEDRSLQGTTQPDLRWPTWLYTGFDAYRRRPKTFPIVVGDDYA